MKHFDTIIDNMIATHKNPNTQYSPTQMFPSANDLSFAISRLMDAQNIFKSEAYENKELPADLHAVWCEIRDDMPEHTAKNLALCIIKNTPFNNTQEEMQTLQQIFNSTMFEFTNNEALSNAFIQIFFGESEAKMPKMRDRD